MKCYKLSEEEFNELYNIEKLLKSNDEESIQLGLNLLDNYPQEAKAKSRIGRYTSSLGDLISDYKRGRIFTIYGFYINSEYEKSPYLIIDFIIKVLFDGNYYLNENT